MQAERRSIGKMPYRRRQDGKSANERRAEVKLWTVILGILSLLAALVANPANAPIVAAGLAAVGGLIAAANTLRAVVWDDNAPINHVSKVSHLLCTFSRILLISLSIDK